MNPLRSRLLPALVFAALLGAAPALAGRPSDDLMTLVPPDAAAVAVLNWSELRGSALGAKLLSETDKLTVDGDAARFMAEALGPAHEVLASIKTALDPNGILNPGKLGFDSPFGPNPFAGTDWP